MGTIDRPSADRIARVAVPVGLGVFTWVVLLLVGGVLLRLGSLSASSVLPLLAIGLLVLPLYEFAPWRGGVTDRVREWAAERRLRLRLTAGGFLLLRVPVLASLLGPVAAVLQFPTRAAPQLLFGVSLFYGERLGDAAGRWLFALGRWYVELLWLYALASGVATLASGGE